MNKVTAGGSALPDPSAVVDHEANRPQSDRSIFSSVKQASEYVETPEFGMTYLNPRSPECQAFRNGAKDATLSESLFESRDSVETNTPVVITRAATSEAAHQDTSGRTKISDYSNNPDPRLETSHAGGAEPVLVKGCVDKNDNEPDWVQDFEPDLIDFIRGFVTFV